MGHVLLVLRQLHHEPRLEDLIAARGHTVACAGTLSDACAAASRGNVDLLVVESSFLSDLRESDPRSRCPEMLVVVYGGGAIEAAAAIDLGADDWLPPCDSPTFRERLAVIDRRLARRPPAGFVGMRELLNESADLLYTLDSEGRFRWVNPSAEAVTGWNPQELLGRSVEELTAPESMPVLDSRRAMRLAGIPTPETYEFAILRPDGTRRWLETRSRGIVRDGKLEGVVGVARDVTDRHNLQTRVSLHSQLLGQVDAAVMALDGEGHVVYWNEYATKTFGWTSEDLRGKGLEALSDEVEQGPIRGVLRDVLRGNAREGDLSLVRKDGSRFLAHIIATPMLAPGGVVEGVAVIAFDLSGRLRAETALRLQERGFRMLFAANPQPMWVYDQESLCFLEVNDAAVRKYGYSRDEFLAMSVADIRSPGETERLREYVRTHKPFDEDAGDWRHLRKDGTQVVARVRTHGLEFNGHQARLVVAEDVTAQRVAEASRALLAAIVESSDAAIIARDPEGRILAWNRAAEAMYGYSAQEVLGETADLIDPGLEEVEAGSSVRALQQVALAGETRHVETRRKRRDGMALDIAVSVFPVADGEGRVLGTAGIARDIGERKKAEREQATLAAIVNSSDDAIILRDTHGKVIGWNPGAERLYGYGTDEVVGTDMSFLDAPGENGASQRRFERVVAGETVFAESIRQRKDGSIVDVSFQGYPVRLANGEVIGFAGISRDISDRKRAEAALRESEARFRDLAESMSTALMVYRVDEVLYVNDAFARMTGYSREELQVPGTWARLVHPDDLLLTQQRAIARPLGEPVPSHYQFRMLHKDGRLLWIDWSAGTLSYDGNAANVGTAVDITERRRAEDSLRESEANYRAVVEGTSDALYVMDLRDDGNWYCTQINRAYSRLLGRAPERVLDRTLQEGVGDEPASRILERYARAVATGEPVQWESETSVNGEPRTLSVQVTPVASEDGVVRRLIGSMRDVTAAREAERTALQERLFSDATIESIPGMFFVVSQSGRYLRTNREYERVVGLDSGQMRSEVGLRFIAEEHRERLRQFARRVFSEGHGAIEADLLTADGRRVPYLFTASRVEYEGEPCIAAIAIDVSERQRAQELVREALADMQAVFKSAGDGIVLISTDMRVVRFNQEASDGVERISGRPLAAGVGIEQYLPASLHDKIEASISRALAGEQVSGETEVPLALGETAWYDLTFSPVRLEDGSVRGVALTARNVTERKRSEETLRQAQKLESLGVLAGGVAHDFNNLLVGILGNAGLAMSEVPPQSPARETIAQIEIAGQRAADLARQMLAYSGKGRFVVQPLDLGELVEEMTQLLRVSIAKGALLQYNFARGLPPVEADATQIRQVVMNLVVNASDAIGGGEGVISVHTGVVHATAEYLAETFLAPQLPAGDYVYLEVADSGSGMDQGTLARIFDPFFTTKFTGRGLGLAAVLGIVRGHRGAIHVASEPGKGTTFRLLLPVAAAAPAAPESTVTPAAGWHGQGAILVVDDEPTVRAVTCRALKAFGFQALEAGDGQEGVEVFERESGRIRAVLLDLTMPRMNGEEAFRAIREIHPDARVVLMSGYSEQDAMSHFAGRGLAGFIQKPYSIGELRDVLQKVTAEA